MINLRNNKGVTLIAEVIAIAILLIIVSMITYSSNSTMQIKSLNNMYADIVSIQEKAANYYLKYGEAPVLETEEGKVDVVYNVVLPDEQKNPNDEEYAYYKVDVSKLLNLTLYNEPNDEEYYYMNTKTLTTYYSKGVTINNLNDVGEATYYTIPSNYEDVNLIDVPKYQNKK